MGGEGPLLNTPNTVLMMPQQCQVFMSQYLEASLSQLVFHRLKRGSGMSVSRQGFFSHLVSPFSTYKASTQLCKIDSTVAKEVSSSP